MVGKKGHACRRIHAIDLRQGVETLVRKQVEKKNGLGVPDDIASLRLFYALRVQGSHLLTLHFVHS